MRHTHGTCKNRCGEEYLLTFHILLSFLW
jgi:hypothetical protein